jgi:multiple sugar transport system substrate-binding protein
MHRQPGFTEASARGGASGITRRQILRTGAGIGGAFVAAPLLAACGGDDEAASGSGELVIGAFEDAAFVPFKSEIFPAFEADTGISVKFLEDEYGTFFEKALNDGQQGGGQYDIYVMDDPWVPEYAANGILLDLGQEGIELQGVDDQWVELSYWPPRTGPRTSDFADDEPQLVAMPVIGDLVTLYWRRDVLKEPPTTWNGLVDAVEPEHDPAARRFGFVAAGEPSIGAFATFFAVMSTFGGELFDDEWNVTFNDAAGMAAAEFLVTELKNLAPAGMGEYSLDQVGAHLFGGRALTGIGFTGFAKLAADPKESKVVDTLDATPMPAGDGGSSRAQSGIFISGISTSAPNRDNAIRFMEWYLREDTQVRVARSGAVPVRTSALEDTEAQSENPILETVSQQLASGLATFPRSPDLFRIFDLMSPKLNAALIGGSVGESLNEAASDVSEFLEKQKVYSG